LTSFQHPILLIIFNRHEFAAPMLQALRLAKPPKIYLAADGPRKTINGETELCHKTRESFIKGIDWKCEIITQYQNENLGCQEAVTSALKWFFSHELFGVILEDDCIPNQDFFMYIQKMYEKFNHDNRIGLISGTNILNSYPEASEDYFFSRYPSVWGWATWARVFQNYHSHQERWFFIQKNIKHFFKKFRTIIDMEIIYYKLFSKKFNTWDYQVSLLLWTQNQLCVIPKYNLIQNIGFNKNSTHTMNAPKGFSNVAMTGKISPLLLEKTVDYFVPNYNFDSLVEKKFHVYSIKKILLYLFLKLRICKCK
jgi:hypothetical protein